MHSSLQNNQQQINNAEQEPLRWVFTAHFADGSVIEQPDDDHGSADAEAEHKPSAFSDVLARAKETKLVSFELHNTNGKEAVTVDLTTGAFIVNGTPLHAHDQFFEPIDHKLELVYFRETRREINTGGEITRIYVNRYFVGWQTNVSGKNVKVTLAVG